MSPSDIRGKEAYSAKLIGTKQGLLLQKEKGLKTLSCSLPVVGLRLHRTANFQST